MPLVQSIAPNLFSIGSKKSQEREHTIERTTVGRKMYILNSGKLGRPSGTNESNKQFLDKPQNQQIKSLLGKSKSVRDITGRLNVSSRTVIKVKRLLER